MWLSSNGGGSDWRQQELENGEESVGVMLVAPALLLSLPLSGSQAYCFF